MELKATKREVTGKATRRLRRQGGLPAVIYGDHTKTAVIQVDAHDFGRVYARAGKTNLIDLVIESGRPHKVLVKAVQMSPRYNTLQHVDFHQVSLREKLQVEVPVTVTGDAEPVRNGIADVLQVLHAIHVECLPTQIPDTVEVDISGLVEVDDAVRIADLQLPPGVDAVDDPDEVVVKIAARRVVEEVEEGAAEPEAAAAEGEAEPAASEGS